jgi:hypothetical protein
MPSPVILEVKFASRGPAIKPMKNAVMTDAATALVTIPVDVWFDGSRTYAAVLDFGGRQIDRITLDPDCRFPDGDTTDNVWPQASASGGAGASEVPNRPVAESCGQTSR